MAATIAATALVRAGTALAKSELERRSRAQRERLRHFALLPGEPPAEGLRRIALGQLDLALEELEDELDRERAAHAVHETRKALKRLRALVRLIEHELPKQEQIAESTALRDMGRRLASARDAEVMVGTLEQLLKRHPRKLGRRESLVSLNERLAAERDRTAALALLGDAAARREVVGELRLLRARVLLWRLPQRKGMELAAPGLERVYRQGRRRYRRALRAGGDRARAMHEWRKRVKDLRHGAEILNRSLPEGEAERRSPRQRGRKAQKRSREAARIGRLARRADALGEMLGEEHDLSVFAERVRNDPTFELRGGTRRKLLRLIARRRRQLRRRAFRDGKRIYRRAPKAFAARVRDSYARGERR